MFPSQHPDPVEFMRLVPIVLSFWWIVGFIGFGIFAASQVQWQRLRFGRLFLVATYAATMVTMPMFAVLLLGFVNRIEFDERMMPAFVAIIVVAVWLSAWLQSPVRLTEKKRSLPLVTDANLLQRVAKLATQMKVSTPLVRLWRSLSCHQMALAYAGKLQDPELVVTDGILHRIDNDESAAIIAHELGHVANGSLWMLAAIFPISVSVGAVIAMWKSLGFGIPFAMAFYIGCYRIISRPIEYDCDRRAARVLGYPVLATALKKIHAVGQAADSGLISLLFYSLSTHPSLDSRIASLNLDLPADQQLPIASSERQRTGRLVSVSGTIIWSFLLGLSLFLCQSRNGGWWAQIPLWLIIVVPIALGISIRFDRKNLVKTRRDLFLRMLIDRKNRLFLLFLFPLLSLLIITQFEATWTSRPNGQIEPRQIIAAVLLVLSIGTGMIWLVRRARWNTAWRRMLVAAQLHDFKTAVEICETNLSMVNLSSNWRHNHAVFKAIQGDREVAAEMIERLCQDDPDFGLSWHFLCSLSLDLDRPERTLEVVESLRSLLPNNSSAPCAEIRALLRLNRLEQAKQASNKALAQFPGDATMLGLAALLVARADNGVEADRLMSDALEKSPGDTFLLVLKAQIKLRLGTLEDAQQAVAAANDSVSHNRFIFLHPEIEQINDDLERRIEQSNGTASIPD